MKSFVLILPVMFILSAYCINGQIKSFSLGEYVGIGEIQGNSSSLTSFCGSIFLDVKPSFLQDFSFRLSFLYARKIEYFLPENRSNKYYPFMKAITLKVYTEQNIYGRIFAEEGIGPLVLNDRIFSDYHEWCYGISFNALIGFDFQNESLRGFKFGLGFEYGDTFTKTSANYYFTYLQAGYIF